MAEKIKLVRLNAVVPFGPGPGVREVHGSAPGVSIELQPGLLVLTKRTRDASGEKLHCTKVPLAQATCIVYESQEFASASKPSPEPVALVQQKAPSAPLPTPALAPLPEQPEEPKGELDDPEEPEEPAEKKPASAPKPAEKKSAAKKAASQKTGS